MPGWRDLALCAECDPEAWFPLRGQPAAPARRVCMACEARAACLEFALAHTAGYGPGAFGIWGGTTPPERRRIARGRRDRDAGRRAA